MMMLLASGQMARGDLRRSLLSASHAMSPWRPDARKSSKAAPAPGGGSALANRTAAKPSSLASRAIRSFSVSAMTHLLDNRPQFRNRGRHSSRRDEAGDPVGEQWPERRSRLEQGVPAFDRLVVLPEHLAEIVKRGEFGGAYRIGKARRLSGKPRPRLGE